MNSTVLAIGLDFWEECFFFPLFPILLTICVMSGYELMFTTTALVFILECLRRVFVWLRVEREKRIHSHPITWENLILGEDFRGVGYFLSKMSLRI